MQENGWYNVKKRQGGIILIKLFTLFEEIEQARAFFLEALQPFVFTAADGTKLPYRLYIPPFYDENKKYPLQVHMHGGGLRGDDNALQLYQDTKQTQMLFAHQLHEPFIFAVPQCPAEEYWSGHQAKNWPWDPQNHVPMAQTAETPITRAVYELTVELARTYSVDTARLYLSGASLGGCGAYELVCRYRDTYAGALIGCAYTDPAAAPQLADTPLYLIHGGEDPIISPEHSRTMAKELEKQGADFVYREYAGKGHDFTGEADGDAILSRAMQWMFAKRKQKTDG